MRRIRMDWLFAAIGVALLSTLSWADEPAEPTARTIATVNGIPITDADVAFMMLSRRVPRKRQAEVRDAIIRQLVDRELMRQFLADRQAEPVAEELDAYVRQIRDSLEQGGEKADTVLARLGYTDDKLRQELALPLAWKVQVRRMVTDQRLRDYYREHQAKFDGTRVRASQILIREDEAANTDSAEERLRVLRESIVGGETTFAEAARQHSEAPSAAGGGDVGFFTWRGRMPAEFIQTVFPLKVGEVSEPFETPHGWVVATVTERKPGNLSLEDVRGAVLSQLSSELWDETVREQRARAEIEWNQPAP